MRVVRLTQSLILHDKRPRKSSWCVLHRRHDQRRTKQIRRSNFTTAVPPKPMYTRTQLHTKPNNSLNSQVAAKPGGDKYRPGAYHVFMRRQIPLEEASAGFEAACLLRDQKSGHANARPRNSSHAFFSHAVDLLGKFRKMVWGCSQNGQSLGFPVRDWCHCKTAKPPAGTAPDRADRGRGRNYTCFVHALVGSQQTQERRGSGRWQSNIRAARTRGLRCRESRQIM